MSRILKAAAVGIAIVSLLYASRALYSSIEVRTRPNPSVIWVEGRFQIMDYLVRMLHPKYRPAIHFNPRFALYAANHTGSRKWLVHSDVEEAMSGLLYRATPWGIYDGNTLFLLKKVTHNGYLFEEYYLYSYNINTGAVEMRYPAGILNEYDAIETVAMSVYEAPIYRSSPRVMGIKDNDTIIVQPHLIGLAGVHIENVESEINWNWRLAPKSSAGAGDRYVFIGEPLLYEGSWPAGKPSTKIAYYDIPTMKYSDVFLLTAKERDGVFYPEFVDTRRNKVGDYSQYADSIVRAVCIAPKTKDGSAMVIVSCRSQQKTHLEKHNALLVRHNPETQQIDMLKLPEELSFLKYRQDPYYYLLKSWYNADRDEVIIYARDYTLEDNYYLVILSGGGSITKVIKSQTNSMYSLAGDYSIWYGERVREGSFYNGWHDIFNIRRYDVITGKDRIIKRRVRLKSLHGTYIPSE